MVRRKRRPATGSFRRQLVLVSATGLLGLALAISLVSSSLVIWRLETFALAHLAQLTDQFGVESAFAFLTGDRALALERATRIATFPGVRAAALLDPDAETWVASSEAGRGKIAVRPGAWQDRAALAGEDDDCWYFAAPVRIGATTISPLELQAYSPKLLGFVRVAWRKAPLTEIRFWLLALNAVVALVLAMGAIGIFQVFLRRLTDPLGDLVGVMRRTREGEENARATVAGPAEIREIGRVFNGLMTRLEQHRAALESAVMVRTLELREARDAALTAARHKSEFVAAMTHEMRTPLQAIIGYTQAGLREHQFLEDVADPEILGAMNDCARIVLDAAAELSLRVDQVLDLAALEAGKREIRLEPVDLPALLARVASILKPQADRNRNAVRLRHEGRRWLEIDGDLCGQVVRNLLDNAIKFTRDGEIALVARCAADALTLDVIDSGIGIPADQLDLIFEPFRQADMSDTRRYGGTGLGLAITRNVCQLLGGTITVDSAVGAGSRFRVSIPLPVRSTLGGGSAGRERPDTAAA